MADYTLSAKITGDSSGFEKAFSTAQKAVDSFGKKISSIGKGISSVGSTLTKKITKPAVAATSALAGITLVKGFNRLVGIDDARAKLTALGHDAESVETIMNSALESVKGTAFGLDEAATTAANAVAAGIKPGQELTDYLKMTADAAAIAGTSMAEMGSIINKVQTGQTVYTEDLEQLADRGLPVYQWLAEEAGVAASEVKQLASDGQISSEMLYNAIEKNIGGAAQIMGETSFSAALDNIGASISRIGANFLDAGGQGGGFFSQLKPLMADLSEYLGTIETKASELGAKFGAAFASGVQTLIDLKAKFDSLPPSMQETIVKGVAVGAALMVGMGPALKIVGSLVSVIGTVVGGIGTLTGAFGALGTKIAAVGGMKAALSGVFTAITGPVGIAVAAITGLVAAFTYLMTTNDSFRNSIMSSVSTIQSALYPIMQQLAALFTQVGSILMSTITTVLQALAPVLTSIVTIIAQLFATLSPLIAQLVSSLAPVITQIISSVSSIVSAILPPLITIINAILSAIQALIPPIASVLSTVIDVISDIMSAITPIISFVAGVIGDIMGIISPIVSFIAGIIGAVVTVISGIISTVSSVFSSVYSIVSSIMSSVGSFISGIFSGIQSAWNGLTGFVSGVFSGISSAVSSLVSSVKGFVNGVISGINSAIDIINKIPGVSIGPIPQLASGTKNWQGGFAYMNEGGRGELTYLPNGAQVIPHDISVQYAKEAARANAALEPLDMAALGQYIVSAVTEQGAQISEGLCTGISRMRFTADDREVVRYMDSLGFARG